MVLWCSYYRQHLSDDNKPPDKYLDNDIAFDRWIELKKFKKDNAPTHLKSSTDHGSVFEVLD